MNSQWHCYYPGGNSSLSYPYHITVLGGRGPYSTPGYAISKASIHTLPHQDFERGRKCCSSGCAFECVTITSLLTLTNCGWLSLSTVKHTFPSSPFTNMYTRKPLHRVCLGCKRQNAVKKIEIWKLPRILIVILNRWVWPHSTVI